MSHRPHIAILDDEPDITALLAGYMESRGFRASQLHSGRALLALMSVDAPAIVLLDLGLPGEDGLAIARQLRAGWHGGLVIVTGRGDPVDKVVGLELGADDYVTKPFDLRELLARVTAVLRRTAPASIAAASAAPAPVHAPAETRTPDRLAFEGWLLDAGARCLHDPGGAEVPLTTGEFDLLATFARHPGRVLSRDFLLEHTRGREAGPYDRTIDVQVGRLRRKLEVDPENPKLIKSVRGAGYILVCAVAAS